MNFLTSPYFQFESTHNRINILLFFIFYLPYQLLSLEITLEMFKKKKKTMEYTETVFTVKFNLPDSALDLFMITQCYQ